MSHKQKGRPRPSFPAPSPHPRRSWRATRSAIMALFTVVLLALVAPVVPHGPVVHAQNYSFGVPELDLQVHVQPDASARLVYDITFQNNPGADPIDIVDIGLPHDNYSISTMQASINGQPLDTIRTSEYIDTGVEIHLEQHAIPPGERGTLHFECTMPDMVYQDTTNSDLASLRITPTWFDPNLVTGTSTIQIAIHMLPGIDPEEMLYQHEQNAFTSRALFEEHAVAYWELRDVRATEAHMVGMSFPKRGMDRVIKLNLFQLTVKWLDDNPFVSTMLLILVMILAGVAFFRFSGGTGFSVFIVLLVLIFCTGSDNALLLCMLPMMLIIVSVNEYILRQRKKSYLPAIAQVEGGGIKRGLSAVEAAIILEQPLNRVLTLLIFGMLKKGILRQVNDSPLTVEIVEDLRKSSPMERLKAAQNRGIVLHKYEQPFLDAIQQNPGKPVHQIDFGGPMKDLIAQTAQRLQGFDLSDTQDYYRRIVKQATEQAGAIGEIPEREKTMDRNLEWLLMGEDYGPVFDTPRYRYRPIWVRTGSPGGIFGGGGSGGGGPAVGGETSFGDVAASFTGWMENTMGNMADAITPGSVSVEKGGGFIDLSGVDRATGDFLEAMAESSGKGGGGGGCACAGCACACACAGGGR